MQLRFDLHRLKKFALGRMERFVNQKQLTIELLSLSVTVCFAQRFLAQLKTMSVCAANINA